MSDPISEELKTALEAHGVKFPPPKPDPPPLYDSQGLWIGGVPNIGAWGGGCGIGNRETREERRFTETSRKKI